MSTASPDPLHEQARANFRHNVTVWMAHGVLAMSLLLFWPMTVAASFGLLLRDQPWVPGALSVCYWLGSYLPQLAVVAWGDRLPTRRGIYSLSAVGMALPMGALSAYLWWRAPHAPPTETLVVLLACVGLTCLAMGVSVIPCWDLYSRIIPAERRGRVIGLMAAANILPTLGYGWLVGRLTAADSWLPFPRNYALLCLCVGVGLTCCGGVVLLVREPHYPVPPRREGEGTFARLLELRTDPRYLRSLPIIAGLNVLMVLQVYFTSFLQKQVVPDRLALAQGAQFVVYALMAQVFGRAADRYGFKAAIIVVSLLTALAASMNGVFLMLGHPESLLAAGFWASWLSVAFILGISVGMLVYYAGVQYTLLLAPVGRTHLYLAATNLPMCVVVVAAPALGQWVVGVLGYRVFFLGLSALGVVLAVAAGRWLVPLTAAPTTPGAPEPGAT